MKTKKAASLITIAVTTLIGTLSWAKADEIVRIGLAVPNHTAYAPVFAAEALGYYKASHLDVKITEFRAGAAAQEALSAGAMDMITYFPAGIALAVSKGAKEKMVATLESEPYEWYLMVDAKSPIKSISDLNGKAVGVSATASTSDMVVEWAANRAGIKVQVIPLGGGGMIPGLRSHAVEATAMFPPLSLQLIADKSARSIMDIGKEMPPTLPDVIVASDSMIDTHTAQLHAVINAIYKALDYMRTHRTWSVNFLKKYSKNDNTNLSELAYQGITMVQSTDGRFEDKWISDSLRITAETSIPSLVQLKPVEISTHAFVPAQIQ